MKIEKSMLAASLLALSGAFAHGETVVSRGDAHIVTGETESETIRVMYGARGVSKTGEGAYELQRGSVDSPDPMTLRVHQGEVSLTAAGSLPADGKPEGLLSLATLWLDAASNVTTDGSGNVTKWNDCREAESGSSYDCGRRIDSPKDSSGSGYSPNAPVIATPADSSRQMVYFGGYKEGTGMTFYKADSATSVAYASVRHVFAVVDFQTAYGFVFGSSLYPFFHPSDVTAGAGLNTKYNVADSGPSTTAAEFLLNGVRCNPLETNVKQGLQLLELHAAPSCPMKTFSHLFNDRNINGRFGGDYVGELLVFNGEKSLTDLERRKISRYLMDKWGISPPQGTVAVEMAEGTSARIADGVDASLSGRGTLVRSGAETSSYRPTVQNPNAGVKVRLEGGTMKADARELNLAVKAGDVLTFDETDSHSVHTVGNAIDNAARAEGSASVRGASETVRFGSIGADVTNLTVQASEVVLGDSVLGGGGTPSVLGTATIANGSFEDAFSSGDWVFVENPSYSNRKQFATTNDVVDWRIGTSDDFKSKFRLENFMPTDGGWALILAKENILKGHVSVSADGDYVFAFDGTGRYNYDNMQIAFSLVDGGGATNTFACCTIPIGTGYRPYKFLISGLKAGAYDLVLKSSSGKAAYASNDSYALLDNFRMDLLGDGPSTAQGVAVPNGSFENTRITDTTREVTAFGTDKIQCAGWTLTSPGAPAANAIAPVSRLMANYYVAAEESIGEWCLRFQGDSGRATSDSFSLPAGRWVLRCKAAKWAFDGFADYQWNGQSGRNLNPKVGVRVLKNGVQAFDETSSAISGYDMQTVVFTNELSVAAGDSVVLEIRQGTANSAAGAGAMMNVDDFEFVPFDTWGAAAELVANGSFSDGMSGWTALNQGGSASHKTLNGGYEKNYGGQQCDDGNAVLVINAGAIRQNLYFPAAGSYSLSFWARSRVADFSGTLNSRFYGGNKIRAMLIDGATTNTIVETASIYSTNFCQTVALFKVPSAGTRTLLLAGVNNPSAGIHTGGSIDDSNAILDCVSVTAAPEGGAAPVLSRDLNLQMPDGGKLRLDYDGEATINSLKIGSRWLSGRIDASDASGLVSGAGVLNVRSAGPGFILIVR